MLAGPVNSSLARPKRPMLRLVLTQLAVTLVAAAVAGLLAGWHAFLSALLGGLCCVVPNSLFALRLYVGAQRPGTLSPLTFFFGEFTKILLTVGLLAAVVWWYRDLNWLALLAAFIIALKSDIILLFRH